MTARRAVGLALSTAFLAAAALVYGEGRTAFVESVGFTPKGTLVSLLLCSALIGPGALGALLVAWRVRGRDAAIDLASALVVAGLIGCVAGEIYLLADDAQFAAEVAVDPSLPHDRPRWWPYGSSGIVYIPGRGTHATD